MKKFRKLIPALAMLLVLFQLQFTYSDFTNVDNFAINYNEAHAVNCMIEGTEMGGIIFGYKESYGDDCLDECSNDNEGPTNTCVGWYAWSWCTPHFCDQCECCKCYGTCYMD